jgi:hypothetical protein
MGTGEGYLRLGSPGRERTHPNTNIERPKWDFGPTSVILCHCYSVDAVSYVGKKCVESKAAECAKKGPVQNTSNKRKGPTRRRYYSRVFRHRNSW